MLIATIAIGNISITRFLSPEEAPYIAPLVGTILIAIPVLSINRSSIFGMFELQRRKLGCALAGSIMAAPGTFIPGMAATIFAAISKNEFE